MKYSLDAGIWNCLPVSQYKAVIFFILIVKSDNDIFGRIKLHGLQRELTASLGCQDLIKHDRCENHGYAHQEISDCDNSPSDILAHYGDNRYRDEGNKQ